MKPTFAIRDIADADFGEWTTLWAQYNQFYGRVGPTALSEAVVWSTWQRLLDPNEPVHGLIAEHKGRLVGLAHYIFHRNTITVENTGYLQDIFSNPAMRGQGIGRALIAEFYCRAEQAGTISVYWHTQSGNEAARRLYDKVATNTEFLVYRHLAGTKST